MLLQHTASIIRCWSPTTQLIGAYLMRAQSPVAYCAVRACLQAEPLLHGVRKQCCVLHIGTAKVFINECSICYKASCVPLVSIRMQP